MTNRISSSVNIIISAFLLAAVNTFCKPCHGLMTMPCERSTRIACVALAVIIAASILRFFLKKGAQAAAVVITVLSSILLILAPVLGKCKVAFMSCNQKTFPALRTGGIFIIVLTVIFALTGLVNTYLKKDAVNGVRSV
ncbi:MAG: DUF4418 family protein [Oscillospiraceae bacterium]|nr:DUF4418 family protein [Oscillospiraceae bacterium]